MEIQPITPAAPIQKTVKIHRDEDQEKKQQQGSQAGKQKKQVEHDEDTPHIDEIV